MITNIKVKHKSLTEVSSVKRTEIRRRADGDRYFRKNVHITTRFKTPRYMGWADFTADTDGREAMYDVVQVFFGDDAMRCVIIDKSNGKLLMRAAVSNGVYKTPLLGPFSAITVARSYPE